MLEISVPGHKTFQFKYLVLDYNGTLACDGKLISGVKGALADLSDELVVHVLTADTFGKARAGLEGIDCKLVILPLDNQDAGKLEYIQRLDPGYTVCVGNGRNDRLMLAEAALGIAVIQEEGVAFETLQASDVVCTGIVSALKLLMNPLRLVASLRS